MHASINTEHTKMRDAIRYVPEAHFVNERRMLGGSVKFVMGNLMMCVLAATNIFVNSYMASLL